MQHVASHTTVPLPKVHAVHTEESTKCIFIEMDYVGGTSLDLAWDGLSKVKRTPSLPTSSGTYPAFATCRPPEEGIASSALQNPA
jgi:hypothetical protein